MRILWITNGLLPEAKAILKGEKELKGTGSWVLALAGLLSVEKNVTIHIASISPLVKKYTIVQGKSIIYHVCPMGKGDDRYNQEYENFYRVVYDAIHPDVVHVHGTEYPHSLAALKACGPEHLVVSLQGLVSVIAPYYLGDINPKEIRRNTTIRDILRPSLLQQQKNISTRGQYEKEMLQSVRFVMGRTSWDKMHTLALNPNVLYFHCHEVLREEFYDGAVWDYDSCKPYTIFVSQAGYPIKGLHKLLKALPLVLRYYPDTQLRVAGPDITLKGVSAIDKLHISTYGRMVKKMIIDFKLDNHITFTGPLNAEQMKNEYLSSNVYICPSIIENSPNSLGEAQLLGVPCLASYVGGVPDMMHGDEDHLYRFEETEMLAFKICQIFCQHGDVETTTMRNDAIKRHDPKGIMNQLFDIYHKVSGC